MAVSGLVRKGRRGYRVESRTGTFPWCYVLSGPPTADTVLEIRKALP